LLTLRAVELLSRADLVLYDQLVPEGMLEHASPTARRVCVSELHPNHPERSPLINQALIDWARQGLRVVRLKGGDPFLFGRGGEEAEALHQAGIPYEIVPGVTAALGAAACAGIPLTHRSESSGVAFVTGHEQPGKSEPAIDWSLLARFSGTLVIYMGLVRLPRIVAALIDQGKDPATPAAAIQRGTTSRQRTVTAALAELPAAVLAAGLQSPTLVIIGSVVAFRDRLAWFEHRPLFGKNVLVTRPRDQAHELVHLLEEQGATVSVVPAVEVRELADYSALDEAIARLERYRWLVFTSVNGVHAFVHRLRQRGKDLRALGGISLAAIGPATADALRSYHLEPDLVPQEYRSEALAEVLRERVRGQRVLLARADRGRELLREQLAEVAEVEQVPVYSQVDAGEGDPLEAHPHIQQQLQTGEIEFITLTSSNIARALLRRADQATRRAIEEGRVKLVSISPVTSTAIRELGLPVAAEATEYTTAGVVMALRGLVSGDEAKGRKPSGSPPEGLRPSASSSDAISGGP
jgi:uroporphyrinogen III methyltransferase/synthase